MTQKVEARQIWANPLYSHKWKIESVSSDGEVFAVCGHLLDGTYQWEQTPTSLGYAAFANSEWFVERHYSKLNQRTLRKRIRDQIAQSVLNGK